MNSNKISKWVNIILIISTSMLVSKLLFLLTDKSFLVAYLCGVISIITSVLLINSAEIESNIKEVDKSE